jgi:hypothetical protein
MADTIYGFFGATGIVDCFVELDGIAAAAFAVETINSAKANQWLSKLEGNLEHVAKHRFRVSEPDGSALLVLKIACSLAPDGGADVFVMAKQTATKLKCIDGAGMPVAQSARGVNVGKVSRGKTSIFLLRVMP